MLDHNSQIYLYLIPRVICGYPVIAYESQPHSLKTIKKREKGRKGRKIIKQQQRNETKKKV